VIKELWMAGRAIAPELRATWLLTLRADLRIAVRNILREVKARRMLLECRELASMMFRIKQTQNLARESRQQGLAHVVTWFWSSCHQAENGNLSISPVICGHLIAASLFI